MPNVKISELPAAPAVDVSDLIPIVDLTDTATKKATVAQIIGLVAPGAGLPDFWTDEGNGKLLVQQAWPEENMNYTVVDNGSTATVTRDGGSWIADGVVAEMLASSIGFTNAANNVSNIRVISRTALDLVLDIATMVAETTDTFTHKIGWFFGAHAIIGRSTANCPSFGAFRLQRPANFGGDNVFLGVLDAAGQSLSEVSVASGGDEVCYGALSYEANLQISPAGDGIPDDRQIFQRRRWAQEDICESRTLIWGNDFGGNGFSRSRDELVTSDANPTLFAFSGYITGSYAGGSAAWIVVDGDIIHHAVSGTGAQLGLNPTTGNVTGIAATAVLWTQTDLDLGFIAGFGCIDGVPTFTRSSLQATANARHRPYSDIVNVQTTDATVTTAYSWTIIDEGVTKVFAEANAVQSTGANIAVYERKRRFKRDGGTVTAGTIVDVLTDEDVAGWDFTIDNSTSTGRDRVTGAASTTITWGVTNHRTETTHA